VPAPLFSFIFAEFAEGVALFFDRFSLPLFVFILLLPRPLFFCYGFLCFPGGSCRVCGCLPRWSGVWDFLLMALLRSVQGAVLALSVLVLVSVFFAGGPSEREVSGRDVARCESVCGS